MYLEIQRVKVYRNQYRPSSSPARFFRSLLALIIDGQSQTGNYRHLRHKSKKQAG